MAGIHQLQPSHGNQKRVIMWTVPRTAATVLFKCLSYVEDALIIYEPFHCARWYGPDAESCDALKVIEKEATEAPLKTTAGYKTSECTYKWAKAKLEETFPDKRFVFCKDFAFAIIKKLDFMPAGYQHVFLIRHPLNVLQSWKVVLADMVNQPVDTLRLDELPHILLPPGSGFKEMSDLIDHLKATQDKDVVVIDSDDLLQDPKGILCAFFEVIGMPFDEGILTWEPGDEILNTWVIPNLFLRGNELWQYYKKACDSTCFQKPSGLPNRSSMSPDVLRFVDASIPYYEKMYAQRLKPI